MTLREAKRRLRSLHDVGEMWWPARGGTRMTLREVIDTVLAALSRPTRLEREAARYLGTLPWVSPEMVSWLARYERKRKGKR
jgi:hypothetical protein